ASAAPAVAAVGPTSPVPSPKFQVTRCVSSVPTSVKRPVKDTACPRTGVLGDGSAMGSTAGATLFTVTALSPPPTPPSSAGAVTVIGERSDAVPVGLSSRYWWLTVKDQLPFPRYVRSALLRVELASPGPQLMTTVCVSSVPGSANEPLRVNVP